MLGVYSTRITTDTIDESPSVYKPTEQIVASVTPTCRILYILKSKINLKATNNGTL